MVLGNLLRLALLEQGANLGDLTRSLPTSAILHATLQCSAAGQLAAGFTG